MLSIGLLQVCHHFHEKEVEVVTNPQQANGGTRWGTGLPPGRPAGSPWDSGGCWAAREGGGHAAHGMALIPAGASFPFATGKHWTPGFFPSLCREWSEPWDKWVLWCLQWEGEGARAPGLSGENLCIWAAGWGVGGAGAVRAEGEGEGLGAWTGHLGSPLP